MMDHSNLVVFAEGHTNKLDDEWHRSVENKRASIQVYCRAWEGI